jgi:hypothetical protein
MRKYGYLVVEGPHDVEFAYRLLSPSGLKRVQHQKDLEPFLSPLIPREYPPKGDLQKRMSTPLFLQNETHAIAIHSAVGDSQLVNVIMDNMDGEVFEFKKMVGIGIFLDSDSQTSPQNRYDEIKTSLAEKSSQLFILPDDAGTIKKGQPNLGAFVLPDNQTAGTLEDLLLESAELVYPDLLKCAKTYLNCAKTNANLSTKDLSELKNAGENKAIIGVMANIFKPGKSVQVSIQDNGWIRGKALAEVKRIQAVQKFLKDLFEINTLQTSK